MTSPYSAAREAAVARDFSHFGRFSVRGADAAALLHHLTTNDIKRLRAGQGCDAVLINSKARVLDWLNIYRGASDFLVITSPNRRAIFAPHATKFILFRQDVQIEEITERSGLWAIFGPQSAALLAARGVELPAENAVTQHENLFFSRTRRLPGGGVFVWSDDRAALQNWVAALQLPLCDDATYNTLRVEAALPVTGLELTETVNPWEAGFDNAISLAKGCYNGQEVVARLHTYKKVKQGLFKLRLSQEIPLATLAASPLKLRAENGRDAGFLTSSALSPTQGPLALGYVRGDYQTPGTILQVETENATATVEASEN